MKFRVWYSTESLADFIIDHTNLNNYQCDKKKMFESDANNPKNFHTLPDHIKKILYLDAPDLIVELDSEPIFSIEVSQEAGTGHNAFQRFARIAASVENDVPAFYIYPEAAIIGRDTNQKKKLTWDKINPLIFKALDDVMSIYNIPAFLYYFPSDFRTYPNPSNSPNIKEKGLLRDKRIEYSGCPDAMDTEMQDLFLALNVIIQSVQKSGIINGRNRLLSNKVLVSRRSFMQSEYFKKGGNSNLSPLTATLKLKTSILLDYLSQYEKNKYKIGELLRSRDETILYMVDASFRGDPYPGALAAIDYLLCRQGKTFEDRKYNLVLCWGKINEAMIKKDKKIKEILGNKSSINDFMKAVNSSEVKNLLKKTKYNQLKPEEVARYYMQVRYGSMFSKVKHIRVFSYFADAIVFRDGALWRDA